MKSSIEKVVTVESRRGVVFRGVGLLYAAILLMFVCTSPALLSNILWSAPLVAEHPKDKVVVHASSCEEGPTSDIGTTSISPTTPVGRRGEYPDYHHISQMVEGPALSTNNVEKAICKIRLISNWHHWHHTYVSKGTCRELQNQNISHRSQKYVSLFQHATNVSMLVLVDGKSR